MFLMFSRNFFLLIKKEKAGIASIIAFINKTRDLKMARQRKIFAQIFI